MPDDVKEAFNETFKDQNKSAIIADLMRETVERAARKQRSHQAIGRILERRKHAPAVTDEEIRTAREKGRPTPTQPQSPQPTNLPLQPSTVKPV